MKLPPLLVLVICALASLVVIALAAWQFVEFKEHPHICAMTQDRVTEFKAVVNQHQQQQQRASYSSFSLSSLLEPRYYQLYEVKTVDNNTPVAAVGTPAMSQHDLVFFIHGNAGNAGEARWYLSELSKLLGWQQKRQPAQPLSVSMFSFCFGEESNIHSGIVLERQVAFVATSIAQQYRIQKRKGEATKKGISAPSAFRCVWLIGHSMGGIVAKKVSARLHHQWKQQKTQFRSGTGGTDGGIDEEIFVCGVFTVASPQFRLPVHLNADLDAMVVSSFSASGSKESKQRGRSADDDGDESDDVQRPSIGVLISLAGGAGDIEVLEPLARLPPTSVQVDEGSSVRFETSSLSLAALSTSHHGITYCHQLVRPLMKTLFTLMTQYERDDYFLGGSQRRRMIRRRLEWSLLAPSHLQARPSVFADVDPTQQQEEGDDDAGGSRRAHENADAGRDISSNKQPQRSGLSSQRSHELSIRRLFEMRTVLILTASSPATTRQPDANAARHEQQESEGQHQQQQHRPPIFAFALPWITARHDVFTVSGISDKNDCRKQQTSAAAAPQHLRFVSSTYNVDAVLSRQRQQQLFERIVTAASSSTSLRHRTSANDNAAQFPDLFPCAGGEDLTPTSASASAATDLKSRSAVVPDSRTRVFWQGTHVSLGASAFWITATWKSKKDRPSPSFDEPPQFFPVVAAACGGDSLGKSTSASGNDFRAGLLLSLRDGVQQRPGANYEWMWLPAFTGGTLAYNDAPILPAVARHCELMLLVSEPLCDQEDQSHAAAGGASSGCWETTVNSAPLPFRMLHAARYCDSAYEYSFAASALFLSLLVVIGAALIARPADLSSATAPDSPFRHNSLFFLHSFLIPASRTDSMMSLKVVLISLVATFIWILAATALLVPSASPTSVSACDFHAAFLASALTLCLTVALAVASVLALALLRLLCDRIAFPGKRVATAVAAAAPLEEASAFSFRSRTLPVLVCVALSFAFASFAPFCAVISCIWIYRQALQIRVTRATPRVECEETAATATTVVEPSTEAPKQIKSGDQMKKFRHPALQHQHQHQHLSSSLFMLPIFPPEELAAMPTMTLQQQQEFLCTDAVYLWWWTITLSSTSLITTVFTVRNIVITGGSVLSQALTHDLSSSVVAGLVCYLPLFSLQGVRYPQPAARKGRSAWSTWRLASFATLVCMIVAAPLLSRLSLLPLDLRDVPTLRYVISASVLLGGAARVIFGGQ